MGPLCIYHAGETSCAGSWSRREYRAIKPAALAEGFRHALKVSTLMAMSVPLYSEGAFLGFVLIAVFILDQAAVTRPANIAVIGLQPRG
jgi:hypothetical protein